MPPSSQLAWLSPIIDLKRFRRPDSTWSHTDAAWVYRYLCNGCGSPATRKSVQGELLRLAYFMRKESIESLSELTSDDAAAYRQWLASDKSLTEVISKPVPRLMNGQINPQWRPFRTTAPLALNAQKTALRLISSCMAFMQDDPSCPVNGNPFRRVAKAVEQAKKNINDITDDSRLYDKALSPPALSALFAYIDSPAFRGSDRSRIAKRWLVTLAVTTAVRVETLVALTTDNLLPDTHSPDQWRLRFRAKHNSLVDQAWADKMMGHYIKYRTACGLQWPALPNESTHLWFGISRTNKKQSHALNPTSVWAMLKTIGRQTAEWLDEQSEEARQSISPILNATDLLMLRKLHPHTLRHTWCSIAVNHENVDLLAAKRHMGHSTVSVTERYISNRT